jgi:cytoskeletal protein RodZ
MPNIAEQLRGSRERQKLSVYDVAEATKIRTDHIRALEEGNYEVFAAPVYIRGFVRTYASLLKLDVPEVLKDLDAELSATKKFSEPPSLIPESRSVLDFIMLQLAKVNWTVVAVLGVGGLVLASTIFGYQLWRRQRTTDPLAGFQPGVYQPRETNAGEVLPLPVVPSTK